MSERELAAAVVAWLEGGWDVYQEVAGNCGVADIVAVDKDGPRLWIIECKTSFSLAVLSQAWHWIKAGAAHRVSVAVPCGRNWKTRVFTEAIADAFGIGVLSVNGTLITDRLTPRLHRKIVTPIRVYEEQKTECKAGSSRGGHWTAFRGTCKAVASFVSENPGCTATELVAGVEHHYASTSSARSSLIQWARTGRVPGVRIDSKRPARFWPSKT